MSVKPVFWYSFLILLIAWFLGFLTFGFYAYMLKFSAVPSADAIVVLTGGADRLSTALSLLDNKKASRLFISGVNSRVSMGSLFQNIDENLISNIELGYKAENTFENAVETKEWATKNNIHSFLLVTSFYHMPRSLLELKGMMPDMNIYPVPVFIQDSYHWARTRSGWLLFVEYNKFIVRYVQYLIRSIFL
ncbi:MAG: YdcF family protein [Alphaproteobacteria bacterium]|nr:YdcF family protein [Alphaproteobacteria bacterium]